jgi:hypothetical protein
MTILFGVIVFRKSGEFDFAEQNSKHPVFLQVEEISRFESSLVAGE